MFRLQLNLLFSKYFSQTKIIVGSVKGILGFWNGRSALQIILCHVGCLSLRRYLVWNCIILTPDITLLFVQVTTLISGFLALFGLSQSHLLIADKTMSKMIQFTTTAPYCYVHKDRYLSNFFTFGATYQYKDVLSGKNCFRRDYIQHTLLNTDQRKIKITSDEEIEKIENICKKKQLKSSYQGGFIYPGTKWCGPGKHNLAYVTPPILK